MPSCAKGLPPFADEDSDFGVCCPGVEVGVGCTDEVDAADCELSPLGVDTEVVVLLCAPPSLARRFMRIYDMSATYYHRLGTPALISYLIRVRHRGVGHFEWAVGFRKWKGRSGFRGRDADFVYA